MIGFIKKYNLDEHQKFCTDTIVNNETVGVGHISKVTHSMQLFIQNSLYIIYSLSQKNKKYYTDYIDSIFNSWVRL